MNEKMAYEQIIAGKLATLPLPDMADAIWARIETQLDLDMPEDGPPDAGTTPKFPTGGTIIGGISILFVIVFVALFFTNKKQNASSNINNNTPSTTLQTQKKRETFSQKSSPPASTKTNTIITPVPQPATNALDSNTVRFQPQPTNLDSSVSSLPITATAVPEALKKDSVPTTKKGRGVSGITDNDYRIIPKKDSANNR